MLSDKILIIDDDLRVIQAVKMICREYEILGFQDATKALKLLQKQEDIALILLDIYMGKTSGLEVLKEIRKIHKGLPVMMVTAFGSMDLVVEALRGGADDFVEKPFDPAILKDKIKEMLRANAYAQADEHNERIKRIEKFIQRDPVNVTLQDVAQELCLDPKYIGHLFKERNGKGFRGYRLEAKINKAKSLLKESSYTIQQIADQLGYQNPESFMRIFKKATHYTPTEYRQKFCDRVSGKKNQHSSKK